MRFIILKKVMQIKVKFNIYTWNNTFSVAKYGCFGKVVQILVNNENAYKVKFMKYEYNMKYIL